MDANRHSVWDSEREESRMCGGREVVVEFLVRPVWLMHDDILWVKGEGPTPNEQFSDLKY